MRYYTKEWVAQEQFIFCGDNFKKIPPKDYSEAEIKAFYDKALAKEIRFEREQYDLAPTMLPIDDLLTEEAFDPEDWITVDEETGNITRPSSPEEVKAGLQQSFERELEDFKNRPPFDPAEAIETFKFMYKTDLNACTNNCPEWMLAEVDHRLLALHLLPENAYIRYKEELAAVKKAWNATNRKAKRALAGEKIPEEISEALSLHDAALLSLKNKGRDLVMTVNKDGEWAEDEEPYRKVTFREAKISEKDEWLRPRKTHIEEGNCFTSNVSFLYNEIYRAGDGLEVHMMFATPKDLAYLTVVCSDVIYEDCDEI